MIVLPEIQEFCDGRDILLIGNATARPFDPEKYLIVRMNYGVRGGPCDIWVNNIYQPKLAQEITKGHQYKYILRLNGERDGKRLNDRMYPQPLHPQTHFWNVVDWVAMTKELGIERPLTGTIALYWFRKYTMPATISVTGMDFFKTRNVYAGTNVTRCHQPILDRQYTEQLIDSGEIKWI